MATSKGTLRAASVVWTCPSDGAVLTIDDAGIACVECGRSWPMMHDIPLFTPGAGVKTADAGLLAEAERFGWETVHAKHYGPADKLPSWHLLLPANEDSNILVLGDPSSSLAMSLAGSSAEVVGVFDSATDAKLCQIRAEQSELDNVVAVVAPEGELPFPNGNFDLIVLPELLAPRPDRESRKLAARRLGALRQKLRPGGALFVGARTRFGIHPGESVSDSVVRSWIGSLVTNRPGLDVQGYRELLAYAGFSETENYATIPSFAEPRKMMSLESEPARDYALSAANVPRPPAFAGRVLSWLGRNDWSAELVPEIAILAWNHR